MARFDFNLIPDSETVAGSDAADLFVEKAPGLGARTLAGLGGNDSYQLDNVGPDVILEDETGGIDTVFSAYSSFALPDFVENLVLDTFLPREATDAVPSATNAIGNAQNNRLTGNALGNLLDGRAGVDTMDGGAGDDTYVVETAGERIIDSAGTDLVEALVGWTLAPSLENLVLLNQAGRANATGNALGNEITGNSFANLISGAGGNDSLRGNAGADTFVGGAGDDTYTDVNPEDTVIEAVGGGSDHVYAFVVEYVLPANVERLTLGDPDLGINGPGAIGWGNALNNGIGGNGLSNLLYGLAGNDNIAGGIDLDLTDGIFDSDTMIGGAGNDTYEVDSAGDYVLELASEGIDLIQARVSVALPAWVENLELLGDPTALNGLGNDLANRIDGNGEDNLLEGYGGDDTIDGGGGDDTIAGGRGNDGLDGGGGDDVMDGGSGNDSYAVDSLADSIVEGVGGGTDEVFLRAATDAVAYVLAANVERLVLSAGGDVQQARGNAGNNFIVGGGSKDLLDGDAGNDTLVGGGGDDTYVIDSTGDVINELAGAGKDTLRASISVSALAAVLENLELTGSADLSGTGNALGNRITGNDGANALSGLAGNDLIDGGAGADAMNGGAGDDTYVIDDAGDSVVEAAGGGHDLILASVALDLGGASFLQVEAASLTGTADIDLAGNALANALTGNDGDNLLTGGAGNDWLSGGALGVDTLRGGAGNDTYFVSVSGTTVDESGGTGRDVVATTLTTYTLETDVEDLRMMATSAVTATGNAVANRIITRSGADALDGGAGNDTLEGGEGNDTYLVDSSLDVVVESAGGGTDRVEASASTVLSAHVELLELTGSAAINGTGNALDNILTGNDGNNVLDGGAGNDTLDGGLGNDTLRGGLGDDRFENVEAADSVSGGAGIDTVVTMEAAYTLAADVENLEVSGGGAIAGTGNALGNRMTGAAGNDTLTGLGGNDLLDGGLGDDSLDGGLGNDTYVVDSAGDVLTDAGGIDTIVSGLASFALTGAFAAFENLVASGNLAFTGEGNALANRIAGGVLGDTLDGGAGADTLEGGTGSDVYFVDNAGDRVVERPGEGFGDEVRSALSYTLGANLEDLTLLGSGNITGTGNSADNVITGNAGNNVLNGGAGNDLIDGGGGNDNMIGGLGNDFFVWDGGDTVAGGAGDDAMQVTVASLDLQALADNRITGVEYLDLLATGVDVTLRATVADILALSDSNRVIVNGNAGDALELVDPAGAATWTDAGQDMIGGILYQVWESGLAQVFVDTDVSVTIV